MQWVTMRRFFLCAIFFPQLLSAQEAGTLFIIGGGARPEAMRREMIRLSGLDRGSYAVVLPMSSAEPDSSIFYGRRQFLELGVPESRLAGFHVSRDHCPPHLLDSIKKAGLIYISGGVQARFMEAVNGSPIPDAIREAYRNGAVIAGTSAGAAVMSQVMITGEQLRYPDDGGSFRHVEEGNVELSTGLGFLTNAVVDQHFVYRMRLNRLINVVLEHPELLGIGIDEATAIVVQGRSARVVGDSQVVLVRHKGPQHRAGRLLGSRDLRVQILLPGDSFNLK
jgi:cyanophycinase